MKKLWLFGALTLLTSCASYVELDPTTSGACANVEFESLLQSEPYGPPRLPGAIWRLALHGGYDYRAVLDVVFDIDPSGLVVNTDFEPAPGVPVSHNRHLRQAARADLGTRVYALPTDSPGGLSRCRDSFLFEFNSRWDDEF